MPIPETERQRVERVLRELLDKARAAEGEADESRKFLVSALFSKLWAQAKMKYVPASRISQPPEHERPQTSAAPFITPQKTSGRHSEPAAVAGRADPLSKHQRLQPPPAPPPLPEKTPDRRAEPFVARHADPPPEPEWPQPPPAPFPMPRKKSDRRSDIVVAGLGVTLGLICAMFPWYIFYNEIRFSTHGFHLGGRGERTGRIVNPNPAAGDAASTAAQDGVPKNLDLFATGTPAANPMKASEAPGLDEQPFPAESTAFHLVYVVNGRAMIEDDAGLWVVQPGSTLPDNSKVAAIEKRNGKWVLVTSAKTVIELSR